MVEQGKDFDDIYDLLALRVITDSVAHCYGAVGIVHKIWNPMPGRFKDYIAVQKSNMYQSLHTSVYGPDGQMIEVQIRTHDMHRTAEYGIAAHWKFKEGLREERDTDKRMSWLREVLEYIVERYESDDETGYVAANMYEAAKAALADNESGG